MQAAEPDDPQDAVVAQQVRLHQQYIDHFILSLQYKESPELYKKTARHWAHIYAGGEH